MLGWLSTRIGIRNEKRLFVIILAPFQVKVHCCNRLALNTYFVSERETVKSSVGNAGFYTTRFGKRSVGPMAAFLNQERPDDYQLPDRYCTHCLPLTFVCIGDDENHFGRHNRFGPGLGFDENTAEFGGYLTKEVPEQCFYSRLMGGLVCSYSD